MALRLKLFNSITRVFKRHGAITIDTPVFELKDILGGKYGEDSKLIYDLQDQGGELCSLRYDLTVPFARFVAMNKDMQNIKRYQIAKVYRRDNPSINKGRMREFYQCDFDIAGTYESMIPDAEVLRVTTEILSSLPIGDFVIKINHRKLLDGMFQVCGVPDDKIRAISSAVDKLDKMPWSDVKKEMVDEKGLDPDVADRIGEYVKLNGGRELVDTLLADATLVSNATALVGVQEMQTLFGYLEIFGVLPRISFDLSLARGLDYYTGVIYEAVFKAANDETSGIGSIAAGGRYDNLVGMFSGSSTQVPCVGVSIGVERVFAILSKHAAQPRSSPTSVYVTAPDGNLAERMAICRELWDAGVSAEFAYKGKVKIGKELGVCDGKQIPLAVIVGANEIREGVVKIKDLHAQQEFTVARDEMVQKIRDLMTPEEDSW
ncbi:Cytoplasmic and mitochondrial histidine tRNA synthetase [Kappamyces sp. JEL0829]|nr:Cytoplasmic and mitochondrial histidine tRNA synthetase [Kappamyces sp. JEL0829]